VVNCQPFSATDELNNVTVYAEGELIVRARRHVLHGSRDHRRHKFEFLITAVAANPRLYPASYHIADVFGRVGIVLVADRYAFREKEFNGYGDVGGNLTARQSAYVFGSLLFRKPCFMLFGRVRSPAYAYIFKVSFWLASRKGIAYPKRFKLSHSFFSLLNFACFLVAARFTEQPDLLPADQVGKVSYSKMGKMSKK
jgi:hypothetical protein